MSAALVQEPRFEFEDTVEIEGILAEHFAEVDIAALRATHCSIGINAGDARFKSCSLLDLACRVQQFVPWFCIVVALASRA